MYLQPPDSKQRHQKHWGNQMLAYRRITLNPYYHPAQMNQSQEEILDSETTRNKQSTLQDTDTRKDFVNGTLYAQ